MRDGGMSLRRAATTIMLAASASACANLPAPDTGTTSAMSSMSVMSNVQSSDGMAGFEWRRTHASGSARFITRDVFARYPDLPLDQVLRDHILGFCQPRDGRATLTAAEPCVVSVYVNGLFAPDAIESLRPADVAGAEYYEAATVPPQYRRSGPAVPVLVLWLSR